jgi:hypothetical protein
MLSEVPPHIHNTQDTPGLEGSRCAHAAMWSLRWSHRCSAAPISDIDVTSSDLDLLRMQRLVLLSLRDLNDQHCVRMQIDRYHIVQLSQYCSCQSGARYDKVDGHRGRGVRGVHGDPSEGVSSCRSLSMATPQPQTSAAVDGTLTSSLSYLTGLRQLRRTSILIGRLHAIGVRARRQHRVPAHKQLVGQYTCVRYRHEDAVHCRPRGPCRRRTADACA